MKTIKRIINTPPQHWVGDGFPVNSLLFYGEHGNAISPFLLADLAGPAHFDPAATPRGVGQHPHRGFETVTLVYQGEVAHKDNAGNGGIIKKGGVQWMTAGKGIIHEEFHSQDFTQKGGELEMIQLWVNLPAKDKMTPPAYQGINNEDIPTATLNNGAQLRVIAGSYNTITKAITNDTTKATTNNTTKAITGPVSTFTNIQLIDAVLPANSTTTLNLTEGHNSIIIVRRGSITINNTTINTKCAALLNPQGDTVIITAHAPSDTTSNADNAEILILSGEPINEPIEGYGPFVMNTQAEIKTAITDYNAGRF